MTTTVNAASAHVADGHHKQDKTYENLPYQHANGDDGTADQQHSDDSSSIHLNHPLANDDDDLNDETSFALWFMPIYANATFVFFPYFILLPIVILWIFVRFLHFFYRTFGITKIAH